MTAAEFESRVCNKLDSMRTSYEKTAQRYEAAIEQTIRTKKCADNAIAKIDRTKRIHTKQLNEGFQRIATAMIGTVENID